MSRESSAWMPLYVGDYLGDTQRLTTEQHGAYLLLILDYWRNGPAPDDDAVLQQITKLDAKTWKKHRPALSRMFQIDAGEWRHKRIDRELEQAQANAERRSSKAQKAAQARWGQSSDDATSNAPSMPEAMLVECPPQSPSPKEKSSEADASASEANFDPPIDPEKHMFDAGVRLLGEAQISPARARPMLGKWKRDHGAEAVIVALGKAQREGAIDPISFIEGCFRNGHGPRQSDPLDLRGRRPDPAVDMYRNAVAREAAEGASGDREDDFGTGLPLPSYLTS